METFPDPHIADVAQEYTKKGLKDADIQTLQDVVGNDAARFRRLAQRRLFGEPFAYIFNKADFLGHSLYVDRRVYIPNQETEKMVRAVIETMPDDATVVDVGCGSGAIASAIKLAKPHAKVFAVDIDPRTLDVARLNAQNLGASVECMESYYVDDLYIASPDFCIADLPYGDKHTILDTNVPQEIPHLPPTSFWHPLGTLNAYQELIQSIARKKWSTTLFFETGKVDGECVSAIIPQYLRWEYIRTDPAYSYTKVYFTGVSEQ
ncbi:methyltransferase [Candidatus Kaiserbacteria bacterium]|nr:methyltransferase [Candidatus Kaiserbacteria bacterium]